MLDASRPIVELPGPARVIRTGVAAVYDSRRIFSDAKIPTPQLEAPLAPARAPSPHQQSAGGLSRTTMMKRQANETRTACTTKERNAHQAVRTMEAGWQEGRRHAVD